MYSLGASVRNSLVFAQKVTKSRRSGRICAMLVYIKFSQTYDEAVMAIARSAALLTCRKAAYRLRVYQA
jgi:hypothetical protein